MAEHNLTIKATLDTSSVQRELDQINRNVMTMNGATGVSGSTRNSAGGIGNLNKISSAIDRLNRTIDKLSNQMTSMGQQALDRGREVMARGGGGGGYVEVGSPVAPVARGKAGPKTGLGAWVKANRFSRADAMPLFMMASWGRQMGSSLEDLGMDATGRTLSFLGDVAGGAATGAIRGGPWGAAIGGLIGGLTSATKALKEWEAELKNMRDGLSKQSIMLSDAINAQYHNREFEKKQDALDEIQNGDYGDYTKKVKLQDLLKDLKENEKSLTERRDEWENTVLKNDRDVITGMERRINKYEKIQETPLGQAAAIPISGVELAAQVFGAKAKNVPDWLLRNFNEFVGGTPIENIDFLKKQIAQAEINLKQHLAIFDELESERKQWKGLRQEAERGIKTQDKNISKFMQNYEKAQNKNEEKRKKLTDKRSNLLLDIEDDYTQQGVDLLTSMGKAGKYMSAMEMASLNQERFSPITKKMDDMQKKLDLLASIDREIKAIDKPVGALKP